MKYKLNYLERETVGDRDGLDFLAPRPADMPAYADRAADDIALLIADSDRPNVIENLRILQAHGAIVAARIAASAKAQPS